MSESMNYCEKCGTKLIASVCKSCAIPVTETFKKRKSKLGTRVIIGVLIAALTILGFNWISKSSGSAGKVLNSVTKALDSCKGDAGCEFAKEALKSGDFIVHEKDTYTNLVNYCDQSAPSELVDNPEGNEDEVYARTNWIVPCINVLYAEYQNKFRKVIANP